MNKPNNDKTLNRENSQECKVEIVNSNELSGVSPATVDLTLISVEARKLKDNGSVEIRKGKAGRVQGREHQEER